MNDKVRKLQSLQDKAEREYLKFTRTCGEIAYIINDESFELNDIRVDMIPGDGLCLQVDLMDDKAPSIVPIDSIINAIENSIEINKELIRKIGI